MARHAVVATLLGVVACSNASGRLYFEGSDPLGRYRGNAWGSCSATFDGATSDAGVRVLFAPQAINLDRDSTVGFYHRGSSNEDMVLIVLPSTKAITLTAHTCDVFSAKEWLDENRHMHVAIQVDCRSADGVHAWGSIQSDDCSIQR